MSNNIHQSAKDEQLPLHPEIERVKLPRIFKWEEKSYKTVQKPNYCKCS